jgi:ATP-dependent helicase/nuclease subunit A
MSKLPPLSLIPAGAGSGKTYRIQTTLAQWVDSGLISPERIAAVTFTEVAAAELRERLRTELVRAERLEEALLLNQAYISTIHGFGRRILTEFAFEAAMSPSPRLLNDDEEGESIRQGLARSKKANAVMSNLGRHGYVYDFNSKKSPETAYRDRILELIAQFRTIGRLQEDPELTPRATSYVQEVYGKTLRAKPLETNLHKAVMAMLGEYPTELSETFGTNASAKKDLFRDFQNLKWAEEKRNLKQDWKLWAGLRKLRISNRSCQLPEDYDDYAKAVIEAAGQLYRHPGPREQAIEHLTSMYGAAQDVLSHYGEEKRNAGLIDFTDMVAMANQLLRENPAVLSDLSERIDCLVIDEFQDTNPLQFSLLWTLREAGIPTFIVGDLKQAIMGFQHADARLMAKLLEQHPEESKPLSANWRTQKSLMKFINVAGRNMFGDDYTKLTPRASGGYQEPLEVVEFQKRGNKAGRAQTMCRRLKALIEDETQFVRDRFSGEKRVLRGGDIAILGPTRDYLSVYATALRELGIRCRIAEDGWYDSRIIEIIRHAMEYVADTSDRHASLYMATTELGDLTLKQGLEQLMADGKIGSSVITALDRVAVRASDRTIGDNLSEIIRSLDLYGTISAWPDADQARANLLRLESEAHDFINMNRTTLASGGYYGTGIKTFLAWLANRVQEKEGDRQPDPRVHDADAVELTTWHSAKGREWPIVAVCGWEREVEPRLPSLDVEYKDFSDIGNILETAHVRYSPKFEAPESNEEFLSRLREPNNTEALRLIYVVLTRSREKLVLEWPSFLDGKDRSTYYSLLRDSTGLELGEDKLVIEKDSFPCVMMRTLPDENDDEDIKETKIAKLEPFGRRAIIPGALPVSLTPETAPPSNHEGDDVSMSGIPDHDTYGDALTVAADLPGMDRGTLLHRCFEILGTDSEMQSLLPRATGYDFADGEIEEISAAVNSFDNWLNSRYPNGLIEHEVPFLSLDENSSVVPGIIDLVVEMEDGIWIVDHKSDRDDDLDKLFHFYWPQLKGYAKAMSASRTDKPVRGVAINWISHGRVSVLELQ